MPTDAAQVFEALGDPTRRAVFELVASAPTPTPVTAIADRLPVSRPAVSQHLRVLREARLVKATPLGTQRIYSLDLDGARAVRAYFERFWADALDRFTTVADDLAHELADDLTDEMADDLADDVGNDRRQEER